MKLREFIVFGVAWFLLGVVIVWFALLVAGCGDTTNLYSTAVAPTALTPAPFLTPCQVAVTPSPGHMVRGDTYLVWTSDCQRVQRMTQVSDTAEPGPDWPTPAAPCVTSADTTPCECAP